MPTESSENLKKRDLEIFLEVNRKSIELETEVAGQNEDVLSSLKNSSTKIDKIISWNIHGGFLMGTPSKPQVGNYIKFTGNGPYYLESELCVNPFKTKKIIFGIGGTVFKSQFYSSSKIGYLDKNNEAIYLSFKYNLK